MARKKPGWPLLLLALAGATAAARADTLTAAQAREDFELAVAAVEAGLPRITWFQSAHDWESAKRQARQALPGVKDGAQLFRVLRPLLSRIGEGHLSLQRSASMRAADRQAQGLLPLDLRWTEAGVWVTTSWTESAGIRPGLRLLAIDGEPVARLLRESMSALGHDGSIPTGVMRDLDGAGYARVRQWMRGGATSYRLRLQDGAGQVSEVVVQGMAASAAPAGALPARSPLATLDWLDEHTARLTVPSFSNRRYREAGSDYQALIDSLFATLRARGARQLILDLRDNGGGSEGNENLLFSHLVQQPMRKYAAVEARGAEVSVRDAQGRRYAAEVYDAAELKQQQRLPTGALARRNQPPLGLMSHWQPRPEVFDGRLIVLAGGNTFSGAAELSSMLHHARRGLFVGEEVAGAHAGNTSGYRWELTLPHSRMQLQVPLLRFRLAWDELPLGRGVPPHCPVAPDLPGAERDAALETARALASLPWTVDAPPPCPAALARSDELLAPTGGRERAE
ncbi:MAG TPA: S41 family peptidase [Roseateles sp.]